MAFISVFLGLQAQGASFGGFVVDASMEEEYEFAGELTDNPIEKGADVSDHMDVKPFQATLRCKVSETPLDFGSAFRGAITSGAELIGTKVGKSIGLTSGVAGAALGTAAGAYLGLLKLKSNSKGRVKTALDYFRDLMDKRTPFTLQTGLDQWENIMLFNLRVRRDAKTGQALDFTAQLRQVNFVNAQEVELPVFKDVNTASRAARQKDAGRQAQKSLSDSNKTIAASLFDLATGG